MSSSINYDNIFNQHLNGIKKEGRYREFLRINRSANTFPTAYKADGQQIIMWCINDYLGMSQHPKVLQMMQNAILKHGIGSGGTRNIGGNSIAILELENELASLHHKDTALVFTSGYIANDTTLHSLAKIMPNVVFFSDEANHASIISGIANSRADKFIYKHVDVDHLEASLQLVDINRPKIIVFESAYSMDGLFSPISQICALAQKYNALTFIDEVHTVGLYGLEGAGLASMTGHANQIDIIQGTLAKAYGVLGGYIASSYKIIDAIRLTAPGFIFTTSLPPSIADAATASIRYLRHSNIERIAHHTTVTKVKKSFATANIDYFKNDSHIIPIIIGDPIKAKQASDLLLQNHGIYVQHINFPTVPRGTERLRIIPTPYHTDQMINHLTESLFEVLKALEVKYKPKAA